MHLDYGDSGVCKGVLQREAIVGQRSGVDHNAVDGAGQFLQLIDQRTFVVGLETLDGHAQDVGTLSDAAIDLIEGQYAVVVAVASAQVVEVGPV